MNWYYASGGQQLGPISETEFEGLIRAGTVRPDTLVWKEGMDGWKPLSQAQLGSAAAASPSVAATPGGVVCSQCGQIFPPDQVIRYGDAWVCAGCKPMFVQKLKEGVNVSGALEYAGFWIRFAAKLLDGIILGLVIGVPMVIMVVITARGGSNFAQNIVAFQIVWQLVFLVANGLYSIFFVGKYGATPGKMACGIKIVDASGVPIGYGRATGRYFAEILSRIFCMIGYIIAGFDEQKRALHDHICSTRVVRK